VVPVEDGPRWKFCQLLKNKTKQRGSRRLACQGIQKVSVRFLGTQAIWSGVLALLRYGKHFSQDPSGVMGWL